VKELPTGFRVLSTEAVSLESLPVLQAEEARNHILSINRPDMVCCVAVFIVESIDAANNCVLYEGYGIGPYHFLAAIQMKAAFESGRRVELIKILNKEP
jgi:hypothetical protein